MSAQCEHCLALVLEPGTGPVRPPSAERPRARNAVVRLSLKHKQPALSLRSDPWLHGSVIKPAGVTWPGSAGLTLAQSAHS
jgi:hypothetical protein